MPSAKPDDLALPITERYSYKNPSLIYGIVISTERESCLVNWDDNTVSSVSKKHVYNCIVADLNNIHLQITNTSPPPPPPPD